MRDELLAAEHFARYEWVSALAPGRRILDAGCGTGYGAEILAKAGAEHVTGVELAGAVVEAARALASATLRFEQGDIARLPHADGAFDLVTCFEVIEHVEDPQAVLAELARVLAPDGLLAISSPNAEHYPEGNPHHIREFATSEFRSLLREAFPSVRLLAQHQWISSALFEEGALGRGALEVRTVKATSRRLGSETYTIALAGYGELPEPPAAAALTGTVELRRWVEHFEGQQRLLDQQADYLAGLGEVDAERREVRRQLMGAEAELAGARAELSVVQADRDEAREELSHLRDKLGRRAAELEAARAELEATQATMASVWDSVSWRATRPLRWLKRLTAGASRRP
jgi:SAM-dependent methyltransferase